MYINKDEKSICKKYMHLKANVNTRKENQNNHNSSNEAKDIVLKGILCHKSKTCDRKTYDNITMVF